MTIDATYPARGARSLFLVVEDDTFLRIEKFVDFWAALPDLSSRGRHGGAAADGGAPADGGAREPPFAFGTVSYEDELYDPLGKANNNGIPAPRTSRYLPYPDKIKTNYCCCNYRGAPDHFPGCYPDGGAGFGFNRVALSAMVRAAARSEHLGFVHSDVAMGAPALRAFARRPTSAWPASGTRSLCVRVTRLPPAAGKLFALASVPLIHCGSLFQLTPRFMEAPPATWATGADAAHTNSSGRRGAAPLLGAAPPALELPRAYDRSISFHHVGSQERVYRVFYGADGLRRGGSA